MPAIDVELIRSKLNPSRIGYGDENVIHQFAALSAVRRRRGGRVEISYDEGKRALALKERGLDFARANEVFDGPAYTAVDDRQDYHEIRYNTFGYLDDRLITFTWTIRDGKRRIISMRKTNDREKARFKARMG